MHLSSESPIYQEILESFRNNLLADSFTYFILSPYGFPVGQRRPLEVEEHLRQMVIQILNVEKRMKCREECQFSFLKPCNDSARFHRWQ